MANVILEISDSFSFLFFPIYQHFKSAFLQMTLTLIYQTHFEDVRCQSGVNHIYES